MPSQGVLMGLEDRTHGEEFPCPDLVPFPSPPSLEASQPFVTAAFEMHVALLCNTLIGPLISF